MELAQYFKLLKIYCEKVERNNPFVKTPIKLYQVVEGTCFSKFLRNKNILTIHEQNLRIFPKKFRVTKFISIFCEPFLFSDAS